MKNNKKKRHNADDVKIAVAVKPIENDGVLITPSQQKMVECVDYLNERATDVYNGMDKLVNNGWGVRINKNEEFVLVPHNNPAFASMWPAVAYAFNADYDKTKAAPTLIVNQPDLGFIHVAPTADKKDTEVLGPVINPCLIGTINGPKALLIPFTGGREALIAGRFMLDAYLNAGNDHECLCDGNCGSECKCHEDDEEVDSFECTCSDLMW